MCPDLIAELARSEYGWESDSFDDGTIALIGVEEVVSRVGLYPEQVGSVLLIGLLQGSERLFFPAELGVLKGKLHGRDVMGRGLFF